MKIGSLCSGYGGLESGLQQVVGGEVAWHVENDPAPSKILAHHWPDIPNYGDIKTVDWTQVEPVDWLTAGYPCQPFSHAGKRKGTDDERHIWPYVAAAIRALRPRFVLLENVSGHLTMGFDTVLADLAALGFDATWGVVRAADAGAPHGRARLFVIAADTSDERHGRGQDRGGVGRLDRSDEGEARERPRPEPRDRSAKTSAESQCQGLQGCPRARMGRTGLLAACCFATPDAGSSGRREEDPRRRGVVRKGGVQAGWDEGAGTSRSDRDAATDADLNGLAVVGGGQPCERDADRCGSADIAWGDYEPAIRRWEHVTGRPAPRPTEPGRTGQRLAPSFVEWMQGLPEGHVTAVGLPRNAQLKALGNGVVPQQCALAVRTLLAAAERERAA